MTDLALGAEIWRYTPETRTWERVYKSPVDIPVVDSQGNPRMTARDIGYRGMAIYTEADGTEALYVAGVSSAPLFDRQPPYVTSGYPPPAHPAHRRRRQFHGRSTGPGYLPGGYRQAQHGQERRPDSAPWKSTKANCL